METRVYKDEPRQYGIITILAVLSMTACASGPLGIDEDLVSPPQLDDCAPSYAEEFTDNSGSMTPIQAEVWLRNIIRQPAYSPLGNQLVSQLSQGRDEDWATLTIGRDLTRTGSSYRFYMHDGVIVRKELSAAAQRLSNEAAQKAELEVIDCQNLTETAVES